MQGRQSFDTGMEFDNAAFLRFLDAPILRFQGADIHAGRRYGPELEAMYAALEARAQEALKAARENIGGGSVQQCVLQALAATLGTTADAGDDSAGAILTSVSICHII